MASRDGWCRSARSVTKSVIGLRLRYSPRGLPTRGATRPLGPDYRRASNVYGAWNPVCVPPHDAQASEIGCAVCTRPTTPKPPMDRFEDAKLRIKEATDLVALIEGYLPLKPRGRSFLALCPFHPEKSPSFTVNPETQHYHCFGCNKSGDVFTFLMEREGMTFREAMETLAERAGVSLEGVFSRAQRQQKGPDVHSVLAEVAGFFHAALRGVGDGARDESGVAAARAYFESRGLAPAIEAWQLGYHPAAGGEAASLRRFAQQRRLPAKVLEDAGLLRNGREPFAGRVIFPILDERGRVVAFGGRVCPGVELRRRADYEPPKYINSPESPFFNKRRVLYGLPAVKRAGSRRVLVVEGYTDVIACHLAGFHGAVATLGTAFTGEHTKTIERYATEGVVLLFDGDRAGLQAAERASRELVNSPLEVRIALMEGGKDPADVVLARPGTDGQVEDPELVTERRARFADLLEGAEGWLPTWFHLLRRRLDLRQAVHLEAAARECGSLLSLVENDLRRRALVEEMARHLAMPPQDLARMIRKQARPSERQPSPSTGGSQKADTHRRPSPMFRSERAARGRSRGGERDRQAMGLSGDFLEQLPSALRDGLQGREPSRPAVGAGGGRNAPSSADDELGNIEIPEAAMEGDLASYGLEGHSARPASSAPSPSRSAAARSASSRMRGRQVAGQLSPMQHADKELLACLLASPGLVERLDDTSESFALEGVGVLVAGMRNSIARGRVERAEVVRDLFTLCSDDEVHRQVLADAARRSEAIADPAAFYAVVQRGRRRAKAETDARHLRQQLQDALAAGDQETADRLTQQLVSQLRDKAPRQSREAT
jgi:DNA primase